MSAQIEEYPNLELPLEASLMGGANPRRLRVAKQVENLGDVRRSILLAAESLVDETDRWTWSIREICDDACLPYNAFHRTFQKKQILVDELTRRWRDELVGFIGAADGLAHIERHLVWLAIHNRRIQFLIAEEGVLEGNRALSRNVGVLLPSTLTVRQAFGSSALTDSSAMRMALSSSMFLVGYLSGFDAVRNSWASAVGFQCGDFMDLHDIDGHMKRVQEFTWLRDTYAQLLGHSVCHLPVDSEVEQWLLHSRTGNLTAVMS